MQQIGYSLVDAGGAELQFWGDIAGETRSAPDFIVLPNGDHIHCPPVGDVGDGCRLVPRMLVQGSPGITFDGTNIVVSRPPPEPAQTPPRLIASLNVIVQDGDVSAVEGAFNLIGALYLDVGTYMVLFLNAEPDTDYFAQPLGGAPCMSVVEKGADYLIINAAESVAGPLVDPAQFAILVYRS